MKGVLSHEEIRKYKSMTCERGLHILSKISSPPGHDVPSRSELTTTQLAQDHMAGLLKPHLQVGIEDVLQHLIDGIDILGASSIFKRELFGGI